MRTSISPTPTDDEAAAISVAIDALWPKPIAPLESDLDAQRSLAWRMSGRWWHGDRVASNDRPWR